MISDINEGHKEAILDRVVHKGLSQEVMFELIIEW